MSNVIETRGVQRRMNKAFEIRDLALNVPAGSIYGFLGPNGSGKTTTIHMLVGLLRPSQGSIALLGRPVPGDMPDILARTGFVPERPHVYASLTVGEAIRYHSAFYSTWDAGHLRGCAAHRRSLALGLGGAVAGSGSGRGGWCRTLRGAAAGGLAGRL
jgi:ABC-type multidrug transport system ATPase subunit